jgi:transcriptional regulator with XRE-family HTH domain
LPEDDEAALLALVGGKVAQVPLIEPADLEVAVGLGRVRGQILAAAKEEGVGVRELARRLKVSAAAVSRQLRSESDMRLSTAILLAHALGRQWHFALSPPDATPDVDASSETTGPEMSSRKMDLPNSFESNGIVFRAERTTPYDPKIKKWLSRPNKFSHPCWHIWANDRYLGIIYNSSKIQGEVLTELQLSEENYYPAYEEANLEFDWPDALNLWLTVNCKSQGLVLANI